MLPLLVAFVVLALVIRRLLTPSSDDQYNYKDSTKDAANSEKSIAHRKLVEEAFEHAPFTFDVEDNPIQDDLSQVAPEDRPNPVLILYATEYGFALNVAKSIAEHFVQHEDAHFYPRIVNVCHYNVVDFSKETFVILVCSTTGDGVPPNEAATFHEALQNSELSLSASAYFSVLALGDRAYPHFCRAGAEFDGLFKNDQQRLIPRVDIDQEDWDTINDYTERLRDSIVSKIKTTDYVSPETVDYLPSTIKKYAKTLSTGSAQYTRNNPFSSQLTYKKRLTGPVIKDGHKEVARIELDISGSGLTYQVGDAVGIVPSNNPSHVTRILRCLASNGDEIVRLADDGKSGGSGTDKGITLEKALQDHLDIATVKPQVIFTLARFSSSPKEVELATKILGSDPRDPTYAANASKTNHLSDFGKDFTSRREVFDVLNDFPSCAITAQQLVDCLRPLHARYYSISSTPVTHPDTIAATVDIVRYSTLGVKREGVASTFLMDRCVENETTVPVFLTHNPNFRLPEDESKPIVMIGPGTGIAPFIAFIEERVASKSTGENILFFGCRYAKQDYLYKDELEGFKQSGDISLYTAFSRDEDEKVYVQHRMMEVGDKLWELVNEKKAHVYVCGDGGRMADDVDKVWREIAKEHGGLDEKSADAFMTELADGKRYQRDVWVS